MLRLHVITPSLYIGVLLPLSVLSTLVSTAVGTEIRLYSRTIRTNRDRGPIHLVDRQATIDDPRPNVCEDVDRRFPGLSLLSASQELQGEVQGGNLLNTWSEHLIILNHPRSPTLDSPQFWGSIGFINLSNIILVSNFRLWTLDCARHLYCITSFAFSLTHFIRHLGFGV